MFSPTPSFLGLPCGGDDTSTTTSSGAELAALYKQGIPLFWGLFSLLRILPTWKLFKMLHSHVGGGDRNANLGIWLRVQGVDDQRAGGDGEGDDGILGFGMWSHGAGSLYATHCLTLLSLGQTPTPPKYTYLLPSHTQWAPSH